ncbi:NADH-quinone oxidoreductase subunit N [Leptolyngbya sp. 7M]|uniref:NADH-quinone oxidoreductase subunit N n=1 Tax=Leptolyngbya sp. 7M TaxID=2812896 RepID=UPI001B8B3925|nr:NADH-quinone oxidoreductase subunit N [Leptolyngbya sp. 7M]QYO65248.1 NADH-quinone oxidoreductase subunit N [Leptolyngbya sp. 7M]
MDLVNPNVNIPIILPELIIAVAGIIVMLYDSFFPRQRYITGAVSLIAIAIAAILLVMMWSSNSDIPATAWGGMIVHDSLRMSFSFVFLLVSALTVLTSSLWVDREQVPVGEYHALLLFATFGMLLMAAGNDLVVIFLGLETLSIATYVMAGLRKADLKSNESAMKYFILGSLASAFLLYGMALIYGATGSTNISAIAENISNPYFPALLLIGAAMLIVGFGFKIAAAPFHVWTPDVYEGAPSPVTGFMAAGPKAAAFASFIRIFVIGFPVVAGAEAAGILNNAWVSILAIIAILTMTVGNVAAIMQENVKRMLAYSSIAHAGYALVGFVGAGVAAGSAREAAIAAVAFYLLTYAVTNIGAFAIVTLLGQKNDRRTEFEDYNGIGFRSPLLSFTLSLFMLSLLGLPLTAGFIGKVLVFRPALEAGNTLLTVVVVAAVLNTAISAYYYLRLIVVMFFKERTTDWVEPKIPAAFAAVLLITVLGVFYLGIFGNSIIERFSTPTIPVGAQLR